MRQQEMSLFTDKESQIIELSQAATGASEPDVSQFTPLINVTKQLMGVLNRAREPRIAGWARPGAADGPRTLPLDYNFPVPTRGQPWVMHLRNQTDITQLMALFSRWRGRGNRSFHRDRSRIRARKFPIEELAIRARWPADLRCRIRRSALRPRSLREQ